MKNEDNIFSKFFQGVYNVFLFIILLPFNIFKYANLFIYYIMKWMIRETPEKQKQREERERKRAEEKEKEKQKAQEYINKAKKNELTFEKDTPKSEKNKEKILSVKERREEHRQAKEKIRREKLRQKEEERKEKKNLFKQFKGHLQGFAYEGNIKQVVIDEAQDYNKLQYNYK